MSVLHHAYNQCRSRLLPLRFKTSSGAWGESGPPVAVADIAGAREAAVIHLFETGAVGRLAAAVAEQGGAIYREIATPVAFSEGMHASQPRYRAWLRWRVVWGCPFALGAAYAAPRLRMRKRPPSPPTP